MSKKASGNGICAQDILCGLYLLREDELKRHNLTKREIVVAQHLLNGEGNPQIARRLRLSTPGVKYHVHNILAKTNQRNREEFCKMVKRGVESSQRTWKSRDEMHLDAKGRIVPPKRR